MSGARSPQIVSELDPDDGDDRGGYAPPPARDIPDGLSGGGQPAPRRDRGDRDPGEQFNLIETDDEFRPINGTQQQPPPAANDQDGRPPAQDRRLADDDAGDGTYLDQQRRTNWTREDRATRRAKQKEGRERTLARNRELEQQVAELQAVVQGFGPKFDEIDQGRLQQRIGEIDREIAQAETHQAEAERELGDAVAAQDGAAISKALTKRDRAFMAATQAAARKNLLTTGTPTGVADDRRFLQQPNGQPRQPQPQPQPQPAQRPPSPNVQARLRDFSDQYPWFQVGARGEPLNERTEIAQAIDRAVAKSGFDPETDDYWDELEDRLERHRLIDAPAAGAPQQPPRREPRQPVRAAAPDRRGPPTTGGSDRAPQRGARDVYISPGRKQAMIEAGVLDRDGRVANRDKFQRQMKAFADFDAANGIGR